MKSETPSFCPPAIRPRFCLVLVWLGDWPKWISYFMLSCARNPGVHWRIFTDCRLDIEVPENVFVHSTSKRDLESRISRKLGLDYTLSYGYKLCDLKPAYGHLFSEYLGEYDFWGYTDMDVVYGDLKKFVTDIYLDGNDVITSSPTFPVGHFTLIRNRIDFNHLYEQCDGFLKKLCSADYETFDEKDFARLVLEKSAQGNLNLINESIQTDDCLIWWSGRSRFLIVWDRGNLFDVFAFRALGYFHFIQSKHNPVFRIDPAKDEPFRFYIDMAGIHPLTRVRDYFSFAFSGLLTLAMTVPWYLKMVLKWILPQEFRRRLRKLTTK